MVVALNCKQTRNDGVLWFCISINLRCAKQNNLQF
jgi:hypothetical protein